MIVLSLKRRRRRALYMSVHSLLPVCLARTLTTWILWIRLMAFMWENDTWKMHRKCRRKWIYFLRTNKKQQARKKKKKNKNTKKPTIENSCIHECWAVYNVHTKQSLLIFNMLLPREIQLAYHWYQRGDFQKEHKSAILAVQKLKKKHHRDHC